MSNNGHVNRRAMAAPPQPAPPSRPPERDGRPSTEMEGKMIALKEVQPGMRNFSATFIVLDPGHEIHSMVIADATGSMTLTLWSGELNNLIQAGDICRVKNATGGVHQGMLSLTCGRNSEFSKISEFFLAYSEQPYFSAYRKELDKRQMSPDIEEIRANSASRPGVKRPGGGPPVGGPPNKAREFPAGGRFPR